MTPQLELYFVAFIDILGFKEMVNHDVKLAHTEYKYLKKLYELYNRTKNLASKNHGIQTIQFSDSIVISQPYDSNKFEDFCRIISDFQYGLFLSGILCRGGISFGKHFSIDSFMFSAGLIDAYRLESNSAVTPRVIISKDLMDLQSEKLSDSSLLLEENDSLHFINFLGSRPFSECSTAIIENTPRVLATDPSIRHKQIWLEEYCKFCFPNENLPTTTKFNRVPNQNSIIIMTSNSNASQVA